LLENSSISNKPIVIIAHEVDGEALATMVVNSARGTLKCLAVKAPGFGQERIEILKDIAVLTGGTVISKELGLTLEDVTDEHFGVCDKIVSDKIKTSIIGGRGSKESIENRIELIKTEKEKTQSDYEKEKLQTRLSKLAGGVAIIRVGAQSEVELKEKKDRVDDAILSTKAAIEEGIVPGGGVALIHAIEKSNIGELLSLSKDMAIGASIIAEACRAPFKAILSNAGLNSDELLSELIIRVSSGEELVGYDVVSEKFDNLVNIGVIDPTKVARTALEKAVSVAGTLLTTSAMIVNEPKSASDNGDNK
jgi:chaperonin GroEL